MKIEDIPQNGWIYGLTDGNPIVEYHVKDVIYTALNMEDLKKDIISAMTDIMTECAQVIQHANAMRECTAAMYAEEYGGA